MAEALFSIDDCFCVLKRVSRHLYKEPVQLECKHYACKACIDECDSELLNCYICNSNSVKTSLDQKVVSDEAKLFFCENLKEIFSELDKTYSKDLEKLFEISDSVEAHFNNFEQDIEIRIESMKAKIDQLSDELFKKLEPKRLLKKIKKYNKMKRDEFKISDNKNDYQIFEIKLKDMKIGKLVFLEFKFSEEEIEKCSIGALKSLPVSPRRCAYSIPPKNIKKTSRTSRRRKHQEPYNPAYNCSNCKQRGHMKLYCKYITCYNCGQRGHMSSVCR